VSGQIDGSGSLLVVEVPPLSWEVFTFGVDVESSTGTKQNVATKMGLLLEVALPFRCLPFLSRSHLFIL
jgi:hypothetical protein